MHARASARAWPRVDLCAMRQRDGASRVVHRAPEVERLCAWSTGVDLSYSVRPVDTRDTPHPCYDAHAVREVCTVSGTSACVSHWPRVCALEPFDFDRHTYSCISLSRTRTREAPLGMRSIDREDRASTIVVARSTVARGVASGRRGSGVRYTAGHHKEQVAIKGRSGDLSERCPGSPGLPLFKCEMGGVPAPGAGSTTSPAPTKYCVL
jgi:hypothetical protein